MTNAKETKDASEVALVTAAKTIGTAVGKVAAAVGITTHAPVKAGKPKVARLAKKNKARLPRKQKKTAKKVKKALL
jgi:hypothetical protein